MSEIPLVAENQRTLRIVRGILFRLPLVGRLLRPRVGTPVQHQFIADTANFGGGDRPVKEVRINSVKIERP